MGYQNKRIAAIDMGTNSFHLIVVEVKEDGSFTLLDREREVIRLGSHKGDDLSVISEGEVEKAIDILKSFKSLADFYKAQIRAISTSAVREAKNGRDFVETVYKQTGILVEIIEGTEEAKLIYLGIEKALPIKNKKVLCVDIGGGSTEFIYSDNGKIIFAESVKVGAVRLSKKFFPDYILTPEAIKQCSDYIEAQIKTNKNISLSVECNLCVGTSGSVNSVAYFIQRKSFDNFKKSLNGYKFSKLQLDQINNNILNLKTVAERMAIPGMDIKRADIIPAGLIILKKIFELFQINEMVISEYALREGIIVDTVRKAV
jgi:exopolyphosphatase/guanosine-5'-triphosphate,3'-diphosphate pyrophosphatase